MNLRKEASDTLAAVKAGLEREASLAAKFHECQAQLIAARNEALLYALRLKTCDGVNKQLREEIKSIAVHLASNRQTQEMAERTIKDLLEEKKNFWEVALRHLKGTDA